MPVCDPKCFQSFYEYWTQNCNDLDSFSLQICKCILYSYNSKILISKWMYPCVLTGWYFSSEDVVRGLFLHKRGSKDNYIVCYEYLQIYMVTSYFSWNPQINIVFVLKSTCKVAVLTFISCGWDFSSWCSNFIYDSSRCRRHIWGRLRKYKAERDWQQLGVNMCMKILMEGNKFGLCGTMSLAQPLILYSKKIIFTSFNIY